MDSHTKEPESNNQYVFYPLKDMMICVDYSRRKIKFKDKYGNVITDQEIKLLTALTTKFFNSINNNNTEQICLYSDELKKKLGDDDIINTMVKIFDYKTRQKTDFHYDFLLHMCSKTVKEK